MFEEMTYDEILQRMLERVPDIEDKRESSPIYNGLAPAAMEIRLLYLEFDRLKTNGYADTAEREYLLKRGEERGVFPDPATPATFKAAFSPDGFIMPIGSRFNSGVYNFFVKESLIAGMCLIECEELGAGANACAGLLLPMEYMQGLDTIRLADLVISGRDEEETEHFRNKYFSNFKTKSFGGNKKDYKEKANALAGVGATKVIPKWQGGNSVKLIILGANYKNATPELIKSVQAVFDPFKDGQGDGLAPIGHIVDVVTAQLILITVKAEITLDGQFALEQISVEITEKMEQYLHELRTQWEDKQNTVVRIAQVESRILAIDGVLDITNTTLNGSLDNLLLQNEQIPILEKVVIE